jgi:hypothetical protein
MTEICNKSRQFGDTTDKSRRSGDTADMSRRSGDTADMSRRSGDTADTSRRSGDRTNRTSFAARSAALVWILLALMAACATKPPARLDDYHIVDCELLGQTIRIGTGMATTGRARALRTSANDCAIRGGYFVEPDQANYQTALKVWLPLAESGDLNAQLYMGQIYEKGLGQAPDAEAAQRWYQRAADRGFAPAQTALAMLYEQGKIGGAPDLMKALSLYRKAANLNEGLRMESDVLAREAQIKLLQTELESERARANDALEKLRRKNIELDESVRELQSQLQSARTDAQRQSAQAALQLTQTTQQNTAAEITQLQAQTQGVNNAIADLQKDQPNTTARANDISIQLLEPASLAMRGLLAVPIERSAQQVRVSAKVTSAQKIVFISINGTPISIDEAGVVRANVQLKTSPTLVEIFAKNASGQEAKLPFVLTAKDLMPPPQTFAAQSNSFGNYHALVIGNENYQYWEPLQSPLDDAEAVAEVLKRKYGFKVTLLKNATRSQVFRSLANYRKSLKENDNLLIYYSGHGSWDSANQQGYWIPIDGTKDDISNYISATDITDQLSVIPARQVLVVADACYSGVLVKSVAEQAIAAENRNLQLDQLAQLKSRKAMSSGNIRQVLDGGAGKHSIFAKQFLDALENRNQPFPARELYAEIAPRVKEAAEGFGEQQEPQYGQLRLSGHVGGDFVFRVQ